MTKRYLLDSQRSRFTVQAFAAGLMGGFAHSPKFAIRQFEGELSFGVENMEKSSFDMTVKAGSLNLIDDVKESDRQQIQKQVMEEVLEVARFPEISFHGAAIAADKIADDWYRAQIRGEMRLHGVTRPLTIDSQLRLVNGDARLAGDFALLVGDYRIKKVTGMAGLIKLKDELKFQFDVVGREQGQETV